MLSVLETPLSEAATRSGVPPVGAMVSTVTARPAEATLVLPARSVCLAVSVWLPPDSVELVIDQLPEPSAVVLPSTVVPLVSNSVTVAPASAPLPVNTGVVTLVMLSVFEEPESVAAVMSGADGGAAVVSSVMVSAAVVEVLPAASLNCAEIALPPSAPRSPAVTARLTLPAVTSAAVMVWLTGCAKGEPPSSS